MFSLLFLGLAISACHTSLRNNPRGALQNLVNNFLATYQEQDHLSSVVLTAGTRNNITTVWAGTTEFDGRTPVNASSLYQIGSITKTFTSVIVLQLEAEGFLSINDPLAKYLPQYPDLIPKFRREIL